MGKYNQCFLTMFCEVASEQAGGPGDRSRLCSVTLGAALYWGRAHSMMPGNGSRYPTFQILAGVLASAHPDTATRPRAGCQVTVEQMALPGEGEEEKEGHRGGGRQVSRKGVAHCAPPLQMQEWCTLLLPRGCAFLHQLLQFSRRPWRPQTRVNQSNGWS